MQAVIAAQNVVIINSAAIIQELNKKLEMMTKLYENSEKDLGMVNATIGQMYDQLAAKDAIIKKLTEERDAANQAEKEKQDRKERAADIFKRNMATQRALDQYVQEEEEKAAHTFSWNKATQRATDQYAQEEEEKAADISRWNMATM